MQEDSANGIEDKKVAEGETGMRMSGQKQNYLMELEKQVQENGEKKSEGEIGTRTIGQCGNEQQTELDILNQLN